MLFTRKEDPARELFFQQEVGVSSSYQGYSAAAGGAPSLVAPHSNLGADELAAVSFPETSNVWASTTTTEVVSNIHHTNRLPF